MLRSVVSLVFAATAFAQTPAGSYAHTKNNLGAAYQNATITPGTWISPDGIDIPPLLHNDEIILTMPKNRRQRPTRHLAFQHDNAQGYQVHAHHAGSQHP